MYVLFSDDFSSATGSTESSPVKLVAFRFDWKIVVAVGILFSKFSKRDRKIVDFVRSDGYSVPDWEIVVGNWNFSFFKIGNWECTVPW